MAQAAATNPFVPKMSWFPKQHDACRARRLAKSIYLIPSRAHESADATGVACPQQTYRQSGGTGPGAATADAAQLLAILNGSMNECEVRAKLHGPTKIDGGEVLPHSAI
jgi:hypothetical protein